MSNRLQKRSNRRGNLNTIKSEESTAAVTCEQCEQCGIRLKMELNGFYRYIATPSAKGKGRLLFCGGCAQVHEAKKELNAKCANCK